MVPQPGRQMPLSRPQSPYPGGKKPPVPATSPHIRRPLCITLGESLAQTPGCPQRSAISRFCPRWRYSGTRVLRTGLAATQVLVTPQENTLVHRKAGALLLRLCIYKDIKKKTENNIPGPFFASSPVGSGFRSGSSSAAVPSRSRPPSRAGGIWWVWWGVALPRGRRGAKRLQGAS